MRDQRAAAQSPSQPARRRGLLAALVVAAGLFVGIGAQAGVLLKPEPGTGGARAEATPLRPPSEASAEPLDLLAEASEAPPKKGAQELKGPVPSAPERSGDTEAGPDAAGAPAAGGRPGEVSSEVPGGSQEPFNVLVLGVDTRPEDKGGEFMGTRADTLIVVQVTPGTGRVELLSIPRDLLVELWPGVHDRINTAYPYGGVELSRSVVEGLTGIPIDHYAIVDFKGFQKAIVAMGGVRLDVEDEIPPTYKIKDGPQTLNGRQALFYARYRGTAGGDLDRIERQQRLVSALRDQALSWDTLTKVPEVVGVLMRHVETDVGTVEALSLARILVSRGEGGGMEAVQLRGVPATMPNGDQVLVPDYATNEVLLQQFRE